MIYCRGGLGRAGTVAACLPIECGMHAKAAYDDVRRVRPGAIETTEQPRALASRELDRSVLPKIAAIARNAWRRSREDISSSGYGVDTLEAALWAVSEATDFKDAVLLAAHLGGDADTVAAVTGQIAGALWGRSDSPRRWLDVLAWREDIEHRAVRLMDDGRA